MARLSEALQQASRIRVPISLRIGQRLLVSTEIASPGDAAAHWRPHRASILRGSFATGAHVHLARKFNGEWVNAEGAIPLILGGWRAFEGSAAYEGRLVHAGGRRRVPCQCKEPSHNGITHR